MSNLPKIVKAIFYVDTVHGRTYNFDVNQDINFTDLKAILVSAANVNKLGLRIFDKTTEKEYTHLKDEQLQDIYPKRDVAEFIIQIDRSYKTIQDHEQLKLGTLCRNHPRKYTIFYCFDCEFSLCSLCVGTGKHENHSLSEKFDYLKPSREIVNALFSDLDGIVDNVCATSNPQEVEDFRVKLKMNYFPSLIELLRRIEVKLSEQVDDFNKHCETSVKVVKDNKNKLKDHCTEGLNELKYQLDIENMLRDEGVYLHFDYKVKEMTNEKYKVIQDTEKLDKIIKSFAYLKKKLEGIYLEIKGFLEQYLNTTLYDDIHRGITENYVDRISKDSILHRLLSEFKKKNGRIISEAKSYKNNPNANPNANFITKALGSTVFNLNPSLNGNIKHEKLNLSDKQMNPSKSFSGTLLGTLGNDNKKDTTSLNSYDLDRDHKDISITSDNLLGLHHGEDNKWIVHPVDSDSKVIVYSDGDLRSSRGVSEKFVKFNLSTHGVASFFPNAAVVNTGRVLYISGGEALPGVSSHLFFSYNPVTNALTRKEDLLVPKHAHSLLYYHDHVYSVGGYYSSGVERYDVKPARWVRLSNLLEERSRPLLFVHNLFLYAFFGYSKGEFLNSVERVGVKNSKNKWEVVPYTNSSNIPLGRTGAAVIAAKDSIFIIGGKNAEVLNTVISFDFKSNSFLQQEFVLEEASFFRESLFIRLRDGDHGLYNEHMNQLLKLDLS